MYKEMGKEVPFFQEEKMNFKERKKRIEADVESCITKAVDGEVQVKVNYSLEQGLVEVNMSKTQKKSNSETINNIVFYNILFNEETDILSVYAFSRVYRYDSLSVVSVINEPVSIDEKFMADMKEIIKYGMALVDQPQDVVSENKEETDL